MSFTSSRPSVADRIASCRRESLNQVIASVVNTLEYPLRAIETGGSARTRQIPDKAVIHQSEEQRRGVPVERSRGLLFHRAVSGTRERAADFRNHLTGPIGSNDNSDRYRRMETAQPEKPIDHCPRVRLRKRPERRLAERHRNWSEYDSVTTSAQCSSHPKTPGGKNCPGRGTAFDCAIGRQGGPVGWGGSSLGSRSTMVAARAHRLASR